MTVAAEASIPKILAVDYGERRIGLAASINGTKLMQPLTVLPDTPEITAEIEAIVQREDVQIVVVGWPRNMQGAETQQTRKAEQFYNTLQDSLSTEVRTQDESLTSIRAKELLDEQKKPYKKEEIDMWAAVIIGQDFLEQYR